MKLAVIAGDGIGPEVVGRGRSKSSTSCCRACEKTSYDLGARRFHATGEVLPDSVVPELREHDAILLGAIGDPSVPSGVLERGLLLRLRFELDHHINLRPSPAVPRREQPAWRATPTIDFVVVREGTEGPYTGNGGAIRVGTPARSRHRGQPEHRVRGAPSGADAFERAQRRRKHLTLVHKNNVLTFAGKLWSRIVAEVGEEYPDVEVAYSTRRRRHHLPGHRPRPLRRDRHRQPVRRHHHRLGRGGVRRNWLGRQRKYRCHPDQSRRCSSRCTAARRTSPVRASPIRPRRSCRWRCCLPTSARMTRLPGWTVPSRAYLATRANERLATSEVGERIAAAL